jgi:hypothetical protein
MRLCGPGLVSNGDFDRTENVWRGDRVEEALEIWIRNQDTDGVKALSVIVLLGVWLARNSAIFEERFITPFRSATQSFNILRSFLRKKL